MADEDVHLPSWLEVDVEDALAVVNHVVNRLVEGVDILLVGKCQVHGETAVHNLLECSQHGVHWLKGVR